MASIISAGTTSGTALNMAGDTSGQLQLATNGSTTALTIDTSQNVGIGTTTPSGKFHVNGGSAIIQSNSDSVVARFSGSTYALTVNSDAANGIRLEAADVTGSASYQPLTTNGSVQIYKTGNT